MDRARTWIWISICFCFAAHLLSSNAAQATISGRTLALDGTALNSVFVQAIESGGAGTNNTVVASAISDPQGAYALSVPPGRYTVRAHGRELIPYHNGQPVEANGEITGIDFTLQPFKKGFWRRFTIEDGLINNLLITMNKAPDGALWIGTDSGASRFDGGTFLSIDKWDGFTGAIAGRVMPDSKGRVWFSSTKDLSVYDLKTKRFWTNLKELGFPESAGFTFEDSKGLIWIVETEHAIHVFDGTKCVPALASSNLLTATIFSYINEDKSGRVWFPGQRRVHVFDPAAKLAGKDAWQSIEIPDKELGTVLRFSFEDAGTAWLQGGSGVWKLKDGKFDYFEPMHRMLSVVPPGAARTRDGAIWDFYPPTWAQGGYYRFDGNVYHIFRRGDGLAVDSCRDIVVDNDGLVFSASNSGLICYDPIGMQVFTTADGLPSNAVADLRVQPDGAIDVVTSRGGLWFSTLKNGKFESKTLTADTAAEGRFAADGPFWFSASGMLRNSANETTLPLPKDFGRLRDIAAPGNGEPMWVSSESGVFSWDAKTERFERAPFSPGMTHLESGGPNEKWSWGSFWLWRGAERLNGKSVQRYSVTNGLPDEGIRLVKKDEDGRIWIAGTTALAWMDGKANIHTLNSRIHSGLNSVSHIKKGNDGRYYFATRSGLILYDGECFSTLDQRDGLPSYTFSGLDMASDGTLWLGTDAGLARFKRRDRKLAAPTLTVLVDTNYDGAATIPAFQTNRRIQVKCDVVDFLTHAKKRQFRFKTLPANATDAEMKSKAGWSEPIMASTFDWTKGEAGNYLLAVQYIDSQLNYSEPAVTRLEVIPPWFENPRIAGPIGFSFIGLVGFSSVVTSRYLRKRNEAAQLRERVLEEERKAREAAEIANKAKSQFIASMSHELRTPLNAIIGYSEMLEELAEEDHNEQYVPDLQKVHGAAKHQLALVNDILDLSKIEADKMTLSIEKFDLKNLLKEVEATVAPLAKKNSNEFKVICETADDHMETDAIRLRQTLFNLLSNACKFTKQGGVTLTIRDAGTNVRFEVTDSGIGISEEQIGKLFQPFTQADAATYQKFGGTGLGLALSRRFAQLMGGDITVTSQAGVGSTFTLEVRRKIES